MLWSVVWLCVSLSLSVCVSRLQEERMALVEEMLQQREAERQALNKRRLEHLW